MQHNPPNLPSLLIPRDDLETQLHLRIQRGSEIRDREITSDGELGVARDDRDRWDEYNIELLRRTFNELEVMEWYTQYLFQDATMRNLDRNVESFRRQVGDRVNRLLALVEKLALIPEFRVSGSSTQATARGADGNPQRPSSTESSSSGVSSGVQDSNRVDAFIRWLKTHPVASVVWLLVALVLILGAVSGALGNMWDFWQTLTAEQTETRASSPQEPADGVVTKEAERGAGQPN